MQKHFLVKFVAKTVVERPTQTDDDHFEVQNKANRIQPDKPDGLLHRTTGKPFVETVWKRVSAFKNKLGR